LRSHNRPGDDPCEPFYFGTRDASGFAPSRGPDENRHQYEMQRADGPESRDLIDAPALDAPAVDAPTVDASAVDAPAQ
jgi:hypothetical protein